MYFNPLFVERERRFKLLWVSPELLMNVLLSPTQTGGRVRVMRVEGLPEDSTEVQSVYYDDSRRAFGLHLWHPSFDVVESGALIPEVHVAISAEDLEVRPLCDEPVTVIRS